MSYLRYLCLLTHSGVQHILRCVFCFVCLRIMYSMLPVSLDCLFLIAPSVFSNVYASIDILQYYIPTGIRFCPTLLVILWIFYNLYSFQWHKLSNHWTIFFIRS